MKKHIPSIITATLVSVLAVVGITYAATPASVSIGRFDTIVIGSTGTGGVTQFNGTIINVDQNTPVTFGDDVRVDGRIWRGANQGPALGDNQPFIINDDAQVAGSLTVGGTDIFAAIDAKVDESNPQWEAQTGYVVAGRYDFTPAGSTIGFDYETGLRPSSDNAGPTDQDAFFANVELPHGATLTGMTTNYYDNAADAGLNMALVRAPHVYTAGDAPNFYFPLSGPDPVEGFLMAEHAYDASGAANALASSTVTSITGPVVDNSEYEYYLLAIFRGVSVTDVQLRNVVLEYTTTSPR